MEPTHPSQLASPQRQAQASPMKANPREPSTPLENQGLKQAALSLKDSSLSYIQSKAELAAIESSEAATYAKQKITILILTAFFGLFTYALILILSHGIILSSCPTLINKIASTTGLNESNSSTLILLILNFILFLLYLLKLRKKPSEELFALTKSEFKKDKQWLAEINQTHEN